MNQRYIMSRQFKIRKASIAWTDKRAKLLLEILGALVGIELMLVTESATASMRIVKYFTYEKPFLARESAFLCHYRSEAQSHSRNLRDTQAGA